MREPLSVVGPLGRSLFDRGLRLGDFMETPVMETLWRPPFVLETWTPCFFFFGHLARTHDAALSRLGRQSESVRRVHA